MPEGSDLPSGLPKGTLESHTSPPISDGERPKSITDGIWTQRSQILPACPVASSRKGLEPPRWWVGEPLQKLSFCPEPTTCYPMRPSQMFQWHRPTLHISTPRVLGDLADVLKRPLCHLRKTVEIRRGPKQQEKGQCCTHLQEKPKGDLHARGEATQQSAPQGKDTEQVLEDTSGKEQG